MKITQIVIAVVLGLSLLGGGFVAGTTFAKNGPAAAASPSPSDRGGGRFAQGGAGGRSGQGGANGQRLLSGQIISVNDGSVTIAVRQPGQNGATPTTTSEIVLVGSSTRVVRTTEIEIRTSDLKAGDDIQIVGTMDASGATSATAVVVGGNALQQLFGAPGAGRAASPAPSPTR